MKKHLKYSTLFAATAGVLGALLRRWLLSAGTDANGLYPAFHPGWIGYLVLTLAAMAALWLATREPGEDPTWNRNFPHGLPDSSVPNFYLHFSKVAFTAAGYALAAVGIGLYSRSLLPSSGRLEIAVCWSGFLCAAALLLLSVQIILGKAPASLAHLLPCVYFALLLFLMGKQFSDEPELMRFLPQVAAIAASALACYQLWGFAVGSGSRKNSLFWSMSALYLCLAAAPGNHVLYIGLALWHLMSHCSLTISPAEPEETQEIPQKESEE